MARILAAAAASPLGAQRWVHGPDGTGADTIRMGRTREVVTGMVTIGTTGAAIGTTGTAIGIITVTTPWSLLVISAFQDGGAGAGAEAGDIRMDITATAILIPTAMDMATVATVTAVDMGMVTMATAMGTGTVLAAKTALVANTALPLGRG